MTVVKNKTSLVISLRFMILPCNTSHQSLFLQCVYMRERERKHLPYPLELGLQATCKLHESLIQVQGSQSQGSDREVDVLNSRAFTSPVYPLNPFLAFIKNRKQGTISLPNQYQLKPLCSNSRGDRREPSPFHLSSGSFTF